MKYTKGIFMCSIFLLFISSCSGKEERIKYLYQKALENYEQKDFREAINICEGIEKLNGRFIQAKLLKAKCFFFNEEYEASSKLFYQLRKKHPENMDITLMLIYSLKKQKKYDEAEKIISECLSYNSADWRLYYELAMINKSKKDFSKEVELLYQAKNILSCSSKVYEELSCSWNSLGVKEKSDEFMKLTLALDSSRKKHFIDTKEDK